MKKYFIKILSIIILIVLFAILIFNIFDRHKNKNIKLKNIRVAEVAHSIFYAPQYVAIHNGYFEQEGIKIDLRLANGADKVTAAVLSGDVDIGFCGSESTIYVYNQGEKDYLKTFAQLTQKDGSFILGREKVNDFKITDLKNHTIIGGRAGDCPLRL